MQVIQDFIIHDAVGKRKMVLDQFKEGLESLNFLKRMAIHPELFKKLFVPGDGIGAEDLIKVLDFPNNLTNDESNIADFLKDFVRSTSEEKRKDLVVFATGAPTLPDFGLSKIMIDFSDDMSIFSSTCSKKITFPRFFPNKETFFAAIDAASSNGGRAFTSV